jgi:hypothetical protein
MNSPKLLEAIAELESQRITIDDAIVHLKRAYAALNGELDTEAKQPAIEVVRQQRVGPSRRAMVVRSSFVNEAVEALENNGKPMHIKEIVNYISLLRGETPAQASVNASLAREEERAKEANRIPRVIKVGRNLFDIVRNGQQPMHVAN